MTEIEARSAAPLIDFPCEFEIKVMGEAHNDFAALMTALIQTKLPDFSQKNIQSRASTAGKYVSLNCTVYVNSQLELDEIYQLLSAHPRVKFAL